MHIARGSDGSGAGVGAALSPGTSHPRVNAHILWYKSFRTRASARLLDAPLPQGRVEADGPAAREDIGPRLAAPGSVVRWLARLISLHGCAPHTPSEDRDQGRDWRRRAADRHL